MALTTPSLSPAIVVREIDLTGVAPNVETSLAGFVGNFRWGPVQEPTRISSEGELATVFGAPDDQNGRNVDYLSASQFLRYSGNLIVCREVYEGAAGADSCLNAISGGVDGAKAYIKNETDYEQQRSSLSNFSSTNFAGSWIAKYPGELGNSLAVNVFAISAGESAEDPSMLTKFDNWAYSSEFDGAPGTSDWATNQPGTNLNDEIHIAIVDSDGQVSGTKGAVLEVFPYLSVAKGARTTDNGQNYFADVINNASNYIWFGGFDSANSLYGDNWGSVPNSTDYASGVSFTDTESGKDRLSGGTDSLTLGVSEYYSGFDEFEDKDEIDVQMLIAPGMASKDNQVSVVNDMVSIASSTRKDCVVVTSPNRDAVINNNNPVGDTIETIDALSTGGRAGSYLIVDNNYLRVYDKFNDDYIFIPAASSTAGIMAATDANVGPWYSPAGEKRGGYLGVTNLAYNATKAQRDELYKRGINPIVQFAGRGILLFGDKTKESRPSAFDRINVRRLFLAIEKSIALAARNFMFEFNDEFTRAEFVGVVEPLLREIQARGGIQDFYVQCDERNNGPSVIDRNEMVASVFVKPARSINFITLNFVAVRTGVDFEEVVGRV